MKITIYELLGLVKDGKAPKKIRYRYSYLYKDFKFDGETLNYISGKDWLFGEDITAMLNDEVEILEEEKEIPEKLDMCVEDLIKVNDFNEFKHSIARRMFAISKNQNEIIDYLDYLKSKGE